MPEVVISGRVQQITCHICGITEWRFISYGQNKVVCSGENCSAVIIVSLPVVKAEDATDELEEYFEKIIYGNRWFC
jgi:hypothetical protein